MIAKLASGCGLLLGIALAVPSLGWAQAGPTPAKAAAPKAAGGTPVANSAAKLLADAYSRTKTARTLDDYSAIAEACERALAQMLEPKNEAYARQLAAWAYNRRGEAYAEQAAELVDGSEERKANELDVLALDDFQAAVRFDPTKWKALHNRGISLALHERYDEALADFDKVIELQPANANTWFNRGEVRARLGQHAAALQDYNQALTLQPRDQGMLLACGNVHLRLGSAREALADFNQVLRQKPDHATAIAGRGDAQAALKQWAAAAEDYRRAIKLDPQLASAYRGAAWLMATCPVDGLRNADLALESARKALDLSGDDCRVLDTLAAAQASAGDFDSARATVAKALEIASENDVPSLQQRLDLYTTKQPYRAEK